MHLVPCPSCDRHVRATERACPFCSAALPEAALAAAPAVAPVAGRGLTRAAILFAGAAAITGCSSEQPVVMYGPAPVDASSDANDASNLPDVVAMYGPAIIDSGSDANDAATDATTDATPPVDAGDG
jgi:hypothetical protein